MMIGVQTVTRSYHKEQHANYLKNCNFLHDRNIYFCFRFTKIL